MSIPDRPSPDRRLLLLGTAAFAVASAALAGGSRAAAGAKTQKADVKYQYTPKDAAHCGLCASFVPGGGEGGAPGTCKIVDGPIPQNGWCVLFSPAK